MLRLLACCVAVVGALSAPALAAKLDNSNAQTGGSTAAPSVTAATGSEYLALKMPLTSAVLVSGFDVDHKQITDAVDTAISAGADDAARTTALSDTMTRIAISYELKLLDATDAKLTEIIDRQADYVNALMDGEGAAVCAPVIFDGSRELIGRGLWDKYAPHIDAVMAVYFDTVRGALDAPQPVGEVTDQDAQAVVNQMAAQGDQALMDYFGVMTREGEQNCPAVLALIKALHVVPGDSGVRFRAQQARGASRL